MCVCVCVCVCACVLVVGGGGGGVGIVAIVSKVQSAAESSHMKKAAPLKKNTWAKGLYSLPKTFFFKHIEEVTMKMRN